MSRRRLAISITAMLGYAAATSGLFLLIGSLFGLLSEFAAIAAGTAGAFLLGRRLGRWAVTA